MSTTMSISTSVQLRVLMVGRAAKLRLLNFFSLFRDLQKTTRFSGGGVVAEIFRDLREPTRFSGGGGGSSTFRDLQDPTWFSGGRGSGRMFPFAKSHFYPTLSDIRG